MSTPPRPPGRRTPHARPWSRARAAPPFVGDAFAADMTRRASWATDGRPRRPDHRPAQLKAAAVSAFAPICSPMNCPWGDKALNGYPGAGSLGLASLRRLRPHRRRRPGRRTVGRPGRRGHFSRKPARRNSCKRPAPGPAYRPCASTRATTIPTGSSRPSSRITCAGTRSVSVGEAAPARISGELEAFGSRWRLPLALGDVGREAEVGHEHPGFAGDVGAQVPGRSYRSAGWSGRRSR